VAGPQFYGGPDLQRAAKILPAANQAPHKIEGLPRRLETELYRQLPVALDLKYNQRIYYYYLYKVHL
jgi:hypothetical protein